VNDLLRSFLCASIWRTTLRPKREIEGLTDEELISIAAISSAEVGEGTFTQWLTAFRALIELANSDGDESETPVERKAVSRPASKIPSAEEAPVSRALAMQKAVGERLKKG